MNQLARDMPEVSSINAKYSVRLAPLVKAILVVIVLVIVVKHLYKYLAALTSYLLIRSTKAVFCPKTWRNGVGNRTCKHCYLITNPVPVVSVALIGQIVSIDAILGAAPEFQAE